MPSKFHDQHLTDALLLENIKSGDADSYETIFRKYYQALCGYALSFLKDPQEAEEIVQEMFVGFWQKKNTLNINTSLKSYLYQSVKNACLNQLKHYQVRLNYQKSQISQESNNKEEDTLVASELEKNIAEAINKLPQERKKIFLMNRNEGLKYKEIAEKLNISIKTVENQMGKALKFLRLELVDFLSVIVVVLIKWLENLK